MERTFKLYNDEEARTLFGNHDENLRLIENEFGVKIVSRKNELKLNGEEESVDHASRLIDQLLDIIRIGRPVRKHEIIYAIKTIHKDATLDLRGIYRDKIEVFSKKGLIIPKTIGQKTYIDAIRKADIVFGIGPAGTGKTYLAMAMAVSALKKQDVSRIILTRPAIEAGENLGFLPGDLYEKITPYLRPLYDALYDMMELANIDKMIERGTIEVAPLAYMRGRTLNDSFVILDEAQNTTTEQMKMFLTRLGFDSKAVITGDITQIDLPSGKTSGLIQAQGILKNIEGIKFVDFTDQDVVRHELVQEIIKAYGTLNNNKYDAK